MLPPLTPLVDCYQENDTIVFRVQCIKLYYNLLIVAIAGAGTVVTGQPYMSGDASLSNMCGMIFAEVYRKDGGWKFRALGNPESADSFVEILKKYTH